MILDMNVSRELRQIAVDLLRVAEYVDDPIFEQWMLEDADRLDEIARALEPDDGET